MNTPQKKHTFHVHGMHCAACVLTVEDDIRELPNVTSATSSLKTHSVEVTGDFGEATEEAIAEALTRVVSEHGYTISLEKQVIGKHWSDFKIAVPVALAFIALFVVLQKAGLVNLVNAGTVSYGTAFLIGIVASLSTCMAVVGGLLLSLSATFAKSGEKVRPQLLFHGGRIVSFFLLGGVIGALGSAFTLNTAASFLLSLLVGLVMLILGINLLDVFPWAKKLQPAMPKFLARHALKTSKLNHTLTPLLAGIATFFLPCGFTQSMQIYTLTTGGFLPGALTMLFFALGTLPVLSLLSFGSLGIHSSSKAGVFFKTAGLIVILFALFNLLSALVMIGLIPPILNF